ncbi:MAG: NAD-dependent epimerase/dehydratase family protein [Urechidicola sp.]|nr:NAD-dependent epimerase/dehydratase family protein [Urechidicola sp.]
MKVENILVIGAHGQIGSVLTQELKRKFGNDHVVASDLRVREGFQGLFEILDATDKDLIEQIVVKYKITQIYHLAAILSAKGEENPLGTWEINMKTMFNVFEVSRLNKVDKVFFPSSIGVFGDAAPSDATPQATFLDPETVYGISKAAGENWSQYYFKRYGLDIRSLRYPGIIGYQSLPGGGTTDYAVDIYHKAVNGEDFVCFLEEHTVLPMIFMDDAIRATIELMDAPIENIKTRTSYNLASMSFSPDEIAAAIQEIIPNFKISYEPDFRQEIAASWPKSIDDSEARIDWHWKPKYNLDSMSKVMLEKLSEQYKTIVQE